MLHQSWPFSHHRKPIVLFHLPPDLFPPLNIFPIIKYLELDGSHIVWVREQIKGYFCTVYNNMVTRLAAPAHLLTAFYTAPTSKYKLVKVIGFFEQLTQNNFLN